MGEISTKCSHKSCHPCTNGEDICHLYLSPISHNGESLSSVSMPLKSHRLLKTENPASVSMPFKSHRLLKTENPASVSIPLKSHRLLKTEMEAIYTHGDNLHSCKILYMYHLPLSHMDNKKFCCLFSQITIPHFTVKEESKSLNSKLYQPEDTCMFFSQTNFRPVAIISEKHALFVILSLSCNWQSVCWSTISKKQTFIYSETSVARIPMANLLWMARTHSWVPWEPI